VEHVIQSINQGDTYLITVAFCLEQVSINFGPCGNCKPAVHSGVALFLLLYTRP